MTNEYKPGVVKNTDNQICGYNISPEVFITLNDDEIERAIRNYVMAVNVLDVLWEIKQEIAKLKGTFPNEYYLKIIDKHIKEYTNETDN